jgi:hypothetical protein
MTQDEIGVMLNLRATLSEYEHFMTELSTMIERGVDVPPCGSAKFPMRDKLYAQVRDLVLGKSAMVKQEPFVNLLRAGDNVHWADGDVKCIGVIEHVSDDGSSAVVELPNGERINVPTRDLRYDGK